MCWPSISGFDNNAYFVVLKCTTGVVKEVLPGKLEVRWITTRCTDDTAAVEPPPLRISSRKLIKLEGVQMETFEVAITWRCQLKLNFKRGTCIVFFFLEMKTRGIH